MLRQRLAETFRAAGEDWIEDDRRAREEGAQTMYTDSAAIFGTLAVKMANVLKPARTENIGSRQVDA